MEGFSLHAAVRCGAVYRYALEHLCRYSTRTALVNERVQTKAAAQVVLKLRPPGATAPRTWQWRHRSSCNGWRRWYRDRSCTRSVPTASCTEREVRALVVALGRGRVQTPRTLGTGGGPGGRKAW